MPEISNKIVHKAELHPVIRVIISHLFQLFRDKLLVTAGKGPMAALESLSGWGGVKHDTLRLTTTRNTRSHPSQKISQFVCLNQMTFPKLA